MQWRKGRRSDNVVDARGEGGGGMRFGGGKGLSIGAILLIVGIGWMTGQDPLQILGQLTGQMGQQSAPVSTDTGKAPPANDEQAEFVASILGDTEDTWRAIFAQAGRQYKDPTLTLFSGQINSACGFASSAVGPFYCPADQKVYLDMSFFREMEQRFAAAGDFAQAYVIAHEVGHHVQTLLGVSAKVQTAGSSGAAGRLPGRRLGVPGTTAPELAGTRRHRRGSERRQRHRRRSPATERPGPGGTGFLYPRHLAAACALVQNRLCQGRYQPM
jgi:predicted metalloprotease